MKQQNSLWQRGLCLLLGLVMMLGLLPVFAVAKTVSEPIKTSNIADQNYTYDRWSNPIKSHLVDNGDGTFTRVEYTGEEVTVERYDSSFGFVSGSTVAMELPLFGGFYAGTNSNFLVFGQANPKESDSAEVVRVVRYSKDWKRVGSASLYGANTVLPFEAGSLRFAEYNGYLYIRTAHNMYADANGTNHQANLTMNVRISDMVMTDSYSKKMNSRYGYISHSFNQFIAVADGQLVAVDHGDALPRAVVLTRYLTAAGQDKFIKDPAVVEIDGVLRYKYADTVNVLNIGGASGNNDTGVALGGFEISNSHYLIAGNTIDQSKTFNHLGQRNIFISATAANNFTTGGTKLYYLTSYTAGDAVTLDNPQFVKINQDRFVVLWKETVNGTSTMHWAFVDGTGAPTGEHYSGGGALSDCQPIISNGKLVWYVTSNSAPAFMTIDLQNPAQMTHQHVGTYSFVKYPTTNGTGMLSSVCAVCGADGEDVIMPAIGGCDEYYLNTTEKAPTCTETGFGYYKWSKMPDYDAPQYSFGGDIPALGHRFTAGVCTVCGQKELTVVQPTLGLKYPTLTFEDVITMNVFFTAENIQDVVEMGLITYKSQVSEWNVENAEAVVPGYVLDPSGFYVASTEGIAAKDMGDTYWFAVYAKLKDGTYTYTKLVSYSPTTYAYNQLSDPAMSKLVIAMLNYGAAAQTYFDYKTDSLMNARLTAEQNASIESYRADMLDSISTVTAEKAANFTRTATGFASRYPTISFEGAFSIDYFCKPSATVKGDIILYYWNQADFDACDVLSIDNATGAMKLEKSGDVYATAVEGIAAKDLDKGIYVAFVYTDGSSTYCSGILGYSIGMYCQSLASGTDTMAPFARATAVYGYYAKQTFN